MYEYAKHSDVKDMTAWCDEVIKKVQKQLREYFTFDIRLIGSGDKRLVMQNGKNNYFDLDYNLILQKDKKNLINNPKQIKQLFINTFNQIADEYGFEYAHNSTSVITVQLILEQRLKFSFDVAILVEGNNGSYYRLTFDKNSNRYIWNEVKHSKNYFERFQKVKDNGYWLDFKERYKELKNLHLSRRDNLKSFAIFLETLNEF